MAYDILQLTDLHLHADPSARLKDVAAAVEGVDGAMPTARRGKERGKVEVGLSAVT